MCMAAAWNMICAPNWSLSNSEPGEERDGQDHTFKQVKRALERADVDILDPGPCDPE